MLLLASLVAPARADSILPFGICQACAFGINPNGFGWNQFPQGWNCYHLCRAKCLYNGDRSCCKSNEVDEDCNAPSVAFVRDATQAGRMQVRERLRAFPANMVPAGGGWTLSLPPRNDLENTSGGVVFFAIVIPSVGGTVFLLGCIAVLACRTRCCTARKAQPATKKKTTPTPTPEFTEDDDVSTSTDTTSDTDSDADASDEEQGNSDGRR